MSERSVVWRIATNFAKARKDADRLANSMERLDRSTHDLDETTVTGDKQTSASGRSRVKVIQELAAARKKQASAERAQAREATNTALAEEKVAQASEKRVEVTKKVIDASQKAKQVTDQQAQSSEALAKAEEKVAQAELSRQKATLALEAAQNRLSSVQKKFGADSQQYAAALLSVKRRQVEVQSSSDRYARSLRNVENEQRILAAGSGRLGGALGGIAGGFRRLGNSLTGLPGSFKAVGGAAAGLAIKFPLIVTAIGYLLTSISALSGAVLGLIGPIGSLGASLAALPQYATVAAGAIGTFVGAFSGIGDALKAGMEAQKGAAEAATDLADAEQSSAQAIKAAQQGIADARRNAARASKDAAEQVKDAAEAVKDAQEAEREAQENLSDARREAIRYLQDMRTQLRDLALQERGASLSVEEARRRLQEVLADPGADSLAKAQAQLAYDEAVAAMDNVKREQKRAQQDNKEAQDKGIRGSDQMQAALEAEKAATEALKDAQDALADARQNQADVARSNAQSIAAAEQALKDARDSGADSIAAATELNTEYQESLENLSPAGRKFVETLLSMQDELKRLKFAAQEGLLPGLGAALTELLKLVPLAEKGLFRFGQVIGDVALRAAQMLTSPEFMPMWNRLLKSNLRILELAGEGFLNLLEAVVYLMDAARPFTEWLTESIVGWTQYWKEIAKAGNKTGSTAKTLDRAKRVLQLLGEALGNLWGTFRNIARASRTFTDWLLTGFRDITQGWQDWTGSIKGQNELKEWFREIKAPLSEFSGLMGDLTRMIFDLGKANSGDLADLISKIRDLVPLFRDLMINLQGDFGQAVVSLIGHLLEIMVKLTGAGEGGLTTFVETLDSLAGGLSKLLDNEGVVKVVSALAQVFAVIAALKFTGILFGLRQFGRLLGGISKMGNKATGKTGFFRGLIDGFKKIGAGIKSFVSGAWKWLSKIGGYLVRVVGWVRIFLLTIGRLLLANPWILLVVAIIAVVYLVIKYWDQIKAFVIRAVEYIVKWIKDHWDIIKWFGGPLLLLIDFVRKNWDKIKKIFSDTVDAIKADLKSKWDKIDETLIEPVRRGWENIKKWWEEIKADFEEKIDFIKALLRVAWSAIEDALIDPIRNAWNGIQEWWGKIEDRLDRGVQNIKDFFEGLGTAVSNIWDNIVENIKGPIKAVIIAINEGLIQPYNRIAKAVPGVPEISEINVPAGFARGGIPSAKDMSVYPGYTPGRDVGYIGISGGEAIMRPEFTRAVGAGAIEDMNRAARTGGVGAVRRKFMGGFARGGIPAVGTWTQHTSGYPWARWSGDINVPGSGDYGNPVRAYKDGTVASVTYLGDTSYGRYIKVNHGDMQTLYAHLSAASVKAGQSVRRGQMIGRVGDLGNASGPHLHFEISGGSAPLQLGGGGGGGGIFNLLPNWVMGLLKNVGAYFSDDLNPAMREYFSEAGRIGFSKLFASKAEDLKPGFEAAAKQGINGYINGNRTHGDRDHERDGRSVSGGPAYYNSGGYVPGVGSTDTVPAMLTPGEFVLTKDAVKHYGVSALMKLNNVQKFHSGGVVKKMARGAKGKKIKALEYLAGVTTNGTWDQGLDRRLQRGDYKMKPFSPPKRLKDDFEALNAVLGLSRKGARLTKYTKNTQRGLSHLLDHTYGRDHDDFAYRPWKYWTPLEASILQQQQIGKDTEKWQAALEKIATWGFEDLLKHLFEQGMDQALNLAVEASNNQSLAKKLNDQLKANNALTGEDFENLIKMVAFMNGQSTPQGLRDIARHLGLSDYAVVKLWEAANAAGRNSSVPASKRTVLDEDIKKWRAGTFYANTGGEVPGSGNRDSVPAMLTPGEFVLRKEAAQALGLSNLWALNSLQKFNTGGLVMAPSVAGMPTRASVGVASRVMQGGTATGGYYVTYDVDINNPVAEKSTRSMMKALQRQSVLGKNGFQTRKDD